MNIRERITAILCKIVHEGALSHVAIERFIQENDLDQRDARFVRKIIRGVLENYRLLDHFLLRFVTRPPRKEIRMLLAVSIYQMKFLDKVPVHAIVNEAVEIAKGLGSQAEANFVNAVLRKAINETIEVEEGRYKSRQEYLSFRYSVPLSVVNNWSENYGLERTEALVKDIHQDPLTYIRVNGLKGNGEELLAMEYFRIAENGYLHYTGDAEIRFLPPYLDGRIIVQDAGSQMLAPLLNVERGDHVLDMCAAPGGKSFQLFEALGFEGKMVAVDNAPFRLKQMEKNAERLGITGIEMVQADASSTIHPALNTTYDKILLDAPCSGLGVARRKPETLMRYNRERDPRLIQMQGRLLDAAHRLLKNGGLLLYSTCTLNPEENEKQIAKFLTNHPDIKLIEEKNIFGCDINADSFYYALMKKDD